VDDKTARSLIAAVKAAAQASTDPEPSNRWRAERDRFVDLLDPTGGFAGFGDGEIRGLVDFLGNSEPSRASRRTSAEWDAVVDQAVMRLLNELS
jgi:hypothetical protein